MHIHFEPHPIELPHHQLQRQPERSPCLTAFACRTDMVLQRWCAYMYNLIHHPLKIAHSHKQFTPDAALCPESKIFVRNSATERERDGQTRICTSFAFRLINAHWWVYGYCNYNDRSRHHISRRSCIVVVDLVFTKVYD